MRKFTVTINSLGSVYLIVLRSEKSSSCFNLFAKFLSDTLALILQNTESKPMQRDWERPLGKTGTNCSVITGDVIAYNRHLF